MIILTTRRIYRDEIMRHDAVNYRHHINSDDIIGGNTVTCISQHHALVYYNREVNLIKANQLSLDLKIFFHSPKEHFNPSNLLFKARSKLLLGKLAKAVLTAEEMLGAGVGK